MVGDFLANEFKIYNIRLSSSNLREVVTNGKEWD